MWTVDGLRYGPGMMEAFARCLRLAGGCWLVVLVEKPASEKADQPQVFLDDDVGDGVEDKAERWGLG